MKFLTILLKEGRKEDLKKKYLNDFDEEDLDFVLGISDLQDFNHKYTDWVLKQIKGFADVTEGAQEVVDLVKDFHKYQKNLEKKDIYQYSDLVELGRALEPFKWKERQKELEDQTEKIYEDENFLVIVPKTQEASCKYGSGKKWCVTQATGDHFERYTRGRQGLYFIIRKKGKETEPHYKVAVHINDIGTESWWDARDQKMNIEAVVLFRDYFPELYSKIIEDSQEKRKPDLKSVDEIFEKRNKVFKEKEDFRNSGKNLTVLSEGFDRISDMPGKAMGSLKIYLDEDLIDSYDMFVSYDVNPSGQLKISVGFSDEFDEEPKFDFKFWEGWGIDGKFEITDDSNKRRMTILDFISTKVIQKVSFDTDFEAYVKNISGPVWRPDRHNYGYTFKRADKGLVKKLVDYLEAGYDNGTKLDFLEYIGKLKSKVQNGKKVYRHSHSEKYLPSNQFRGHFASFFASAKNAGIIQYQKDGSKFIIKKGPNFDAFKEGKLRAL